MLEEIFAQQKKMQKSSFGVNVDQLNDDEKIVFIKDMIIALEDELHEALAEVGWKPWASSKHINRDAFANELIDAFHFLINLFLVVGVDASELAERYYSKADKNKKRQIEGYDGLKGKCSICSRSFDDYL